MATSTTPAAGTNGTPAGTSKPSPAAKAVARHARKLARKAGNGSNPGKPSKGTGKPSKGTKAAPAKLVRANPTNTVAKAYTAKAHGVPVQVTPVQGRGGNRVTVHGHNVCAVLRLLGSKGWGAARATVLLGKLGLGGVVGTSTVGCQVYGYKVRGTPAPLTGAQYAQLAKLAPQG